MRQFLHAAALTLFGCLVLVCPKLAGAVESLPSHSAVTAAAAEPALTAVGHPPAGAHQGPFFYECEFQLEVAGAFTFVTHTRFCRSQFLRMRFAANPSRDGWLFHSLGLVESDGVVNFGLGEGPRRHQRYLLFGSTPTPEEEKLAREKVVNMEGVLGCALGGGTGDEPEKKTLLNEYVWKNPGAGFQFVMASDGRVVHVANHAEIGVLLQEGGAHTKPRFFETLKHSLLSLPALSPMKDGPGSSQAGQRWGVSVDAVYLGLADLVRQVYDRKMTILDLESTEDQRIGYSAENVPGTDLLRIRAEAGPFRPVEVRVSGLKGSLGIKALRREVFFDLGGKRVVRDEIDVDFEVERSTRIFRVAGQRSRVRFSLAERNASQDGSAAK